MHMFICSLSPYLPLQLSWYQQVLAGCPEFNVSQYMGESLDLERFKIVLTSEETKPWYTQSHTTPCEHTAHCTCEHSSVHRMYVMFNCQGS